MSKLYQCLHDSNPSGIPHEDAVQLLLWIYSTLDILPESLRGEELNKHALGEVFSRLEKEGIILTRSEPDEQGEEESVRSRWTALPGEMLSGRIDLDRTFEQQASMYLAVTP